MEDSSPPIEATAIINEYGNISSDDHSSDDEALAQTLANRQIQEPHIVGQRQILQLPQIIQQPNNTGPGPIKEEMKIAKDRRVSTPTTPPSPPTVAKMADTLEGNMPTHFQSGRESDMRREEDRLKTFGNWPVPFMRPQDLAKSGFYYLGRGDEVRCAFCKVEIMRWEEGDKPEVDHNRWAPQCPLLRRYPTGNVPISTYSTVEGKGECQMLAPPLSDTKINKPVHSQYASELARLRTFRNCPKSVEHKKTELAEAGFFYTGQADKTKCFYCDGGLRDWEHEDVPWKQHARWFDRCPFVQLIKGNDFIINVITEYAYIGFEKRPDPAVTPRIEDRAPSVDTKINKPVHPQYASELARLRTFQNWPQSVEHKKTELAEAGFFYTGQADKTKCFYCDGGLRDWEHEAVPWKEHARSFDLCPFVQLIKGNDFIKNVITEYAYIGFEKRPDPAVTPRIEDRAPSVDTKINKPVHPQYASELARLRTFQNWPQSVEHKKTELAEAGFFYTGQADKTKCFYCDGGLRDWEHEAVPWKEHARSFDLCPFVQLIKGNDFIKNVKSEQIQTGFKKRPDPAVTPGIEDRAPSVDDYRLCKICCVEEWNVCFIPCGHAVACAKCSLSSDKCPICRRTFTNVVQLYFTQTLPT